VARSRRQQMPNQTQRIPWQHATSLPEPSFAIKLTTSMFDCTRNQAIELKDDSHGISTMKTCVFCDVRQELGFAVVSEVCITANHPEISVADGRRMGSDSRRTDSG
jgi:hypothetical protein